MRTRLVSTYALCLVVIACRAGGTVPVQSQRDRLRDTYSELTVLLVDKDLEGCDIEPFRDALKRVQADFSRGATSEAVRRLDGLVERARALTPARGEPTKPTTTPAARAYQPSDHPEEAAVGIPFYSRPDSEFQIAETFYVSQDAAGASNRNDGLSPTFESGTRGPFKDFNALHVRAKLVGRADGVRVVVGAGVYRIEDLGEGGILLDGRGDELHPTILQGAAEASPVIVPAASLGTREPILVAGRHGIVERLVVKRVGNKYDLLVVGDAVMIRHNTFEGPWMEDAIKIGAETEHCLIFNNDVSDHGSQAVDSFGTDILIKENRVHHSAGDKGMGFGTKGGTRRHVYLGNVLHHLSRGLGGGGTGDLELYRRDGSGRLLHAALEVSMLDNTLHDIDGIVVTFESCKDCVFVGNRVFDSKGGYQVGIDPNVLEGPYGDLARGLPHSEGIVIADNLFANLTSGFVGLVEGHSRRGFVSQDNVYYMDGTPIFAFRDRTFEKLTHQGFVAALNTDRTSRIRPAREFVR